MKAAAAQPSKWASAINIGGTVLSMGATGILLYQALQPKTALASTPAGGQTTQPVGVLVLSVGKPFAPSDATGASATLLQEVQSACQSVLGAGTTCVSFTQIPLASDDPNASGLWEVAPAETTPTTLASLNTQLAAYLAKQRSGAPTMSFVASPAPATWSTTQSAGGGSVSTSAAHTLTIQASSSAGAPAVTAADVTAFLTTLQALPSTAVGAVAQNSTAGIWTAQVTPPQGSQSTQALQDATVTYGGHSQAFVITSAQ